MTRDFDSMNRFHQPFRARIQQGFSLTIVLLILVITSLLGIGASQIALMSERGARSDRDQQVAWQSAEAALIDAEVDMINSTSTRNTLFDGKNVIPFVPGCGTSGSSRGLCAMVSTGKPAWLTADFTSTADSAPTVAFGTFTTQTLPTGVGVQPSKPPRYLIEILPDPVGDKTGNASPSYLYRVTAMGFGPRSDTQAVLQMITRN